MADIKLRAIISAEDKASAKIKTASSSFGKLAGAVGVGTTAANIFQKGLSFLTGTIKEGLQAGKEQEASMAKVNAILKTLNIGTEKSALVVQKAGKAALQMGFDDDAGALSAAKFLQVTKDTKVAQNALGVAMDLARFKGIDLESATQATTLAYSGNFRLLKQLGIEVPENASKLEVLGMIHDKVKGQAEAFGNTAAGAQAKLAENVSNVREQFGVALAKGLTPFINRLTGWITRPETQVFLENLATKFGQLMETLMTIAEKVMPVLSKAWNTLEDSIADVIIALGKVKKIYEKVSNAIGGKIGEVKGGWGEFKKIITGKASGGYVASGRPYMVGEQGSELFIPGQSGNIMPNNKLGGSININFNNPIVRSDNDLNRIISEVKRVLNREQVVANLRI